MTTEQRGGINIPADHIIRLPNERVEGLRVMLDEGIARNNPRNNPDIDVDQWHQTTYEIALMRKLLKSGLVDVGLLAAQLVRKEGYTFDGDLFEAACNTVHGFIVTGVKLANPQVGLQQLEEDSPF